MVQAVGKVDGDVRKRNVAWAKIAVPFRRWSLSREHPAEMLGVEYVGGMMV